MDVIEPLRRHLLKSDFFFFFFLMKARGAIQNYAEEKVLKETDKLESRKSLELLSLLKRKNDKRAELVVKAFICCPNRRYTGMLEDVRCPRCSKGSSGE